MSDKENCHKCQHKRKVYKRLSLKYYPAKFGCAWFKSNRIRPPAKCEMFLRKEAKAISNEVEECPVNAALLEMRKNDISFQVKEFLDCTGILRENLHYHFKHPNARWVREDHRNKIEAFFKHEFDGAVVSDHANLRMIKAKAKVTL